MKKVAVLGAGMVGSAMALDLAPACEVTALDLHAHALQALKARNPRIHVHQMDLRDQAALKAFLAPFDWVVCAVPGFMGYQCLKGIIDAGKHVTDISFFPEDALSLAELAHQKGVTAIVDCGVAPGMGNMLLGYHDARMQVYTFECLVGGLPKARTWPWAYKAPFSPVDVIEEYTRPARYVQHGQLITRPALTDVSLHEFDGVGTLEAFNTDGLRSLIHTMKHIPNMKEKTLRYPGYAEYIQVLKQSGFFETKAVEINGRKISPLEFTSHILFKNWQLGPQEPEITLMRIHIQGMQQQKARSVTYELYDEYDAATQTSSMARTTGYTATAVTRLCLEGLFEERGLFPPEWVGKHPACMQYVLNYLEERGITYKKMVK